MTQLHFAGASFRLRRSEPAQQPEVELRKSARASAHKAVAAAEEALLAEDGRPACREHWQRMASAFEQRAAAWRLLAGTCESDPYGHTSRAMELAAGSDAMCAKMLRGRLAVSG